MKAGVVGKVPKAICTDNDSEKSKGLLTFEPYDPSFKNPENLDNKGGVAEALFQLLRAERMRLKIIRAFDGESKFTVVDMKVNGRQNCHGHGLVSDDDGSCTCDHGTEGETCSSCKALFNGAPQWYRWTKGTPFQCISCECNNHADACEYDADVDGGICTDCAHHTNGEQCDKCDAGYFRAKGDAVDAEDACSECSCSADGSTSAVCVRDVFAAADGQYITHLFV